MFAAGVALDLVILADRPAGLESTDWLRTRLPVRRFSTWKRTLSSSLVAGAMATGQVTSESFM